MRLLALVLLIGAGFSFAYLFNIFSFTHSLATISSTAQDIPSPDPDFDKDGLSDEEESIWGTDWQNPDTDSDGFKDGEEIISGHNPTIPGPDDILDINVSQNITEKVKRLVLGGIYEGSLQADSPTIDISLDQLADEIIFQHAVNTGSHSSPKLTLIDASPKSLESYGQAITPVLSMIGNDLPLGLLRFSEAAEKGNLNTFFNSLEEKELRPINTRIQTLSTMVVPKTWEQTHINLIHFLEDVRRNYELLRKLNEDPFEGVVSFSNLFNLLYQEIFNVLEPYGQPS